jgi:hypothetical protein
LRVRTAVAVLAGAWMLAAVGLMPASADASGWGRPFRLTSPYSTDLTPASVAVAGNGAAAAGFSVQDQDHPAVSQPFVTMRSPGGRVSSPRAVPGAQLVLDLSYTGTTLKLLTGTSERGNACCSSVQAVSLSGGRLGRPQTLVGKLTGATIGSLTTLPSGRLLATIATDRGVWVAQTQPGSGFGAAHRLTAGSAMPWTIAASADPRGQTVVAWTATHGQQGEVAPNQIVAAAGSERSAPSNARTVFTAAAGRSLDELVLAPAASAVTGGWIESWFDRGAYRSQVVASDLAAGSRGRVFSVPGQTPSGLQIAGNGRGDELATWKLCGSPGTCTAMASVRRRGGQFGAAQGLGPIDPGQSPVAAVAADGDSLVGWIASGQAYAAERAPGASRLGGRRTISSTSYASNLALAFGPGHTALAAWTQGTLAPDVVGAAFSGS